MKYKTEWNLGLLYKSHNDPQIEADMQAIEKACAAFEKKYKNTDFISTAPKLLSALKSYEKLLLSCTYKPLWYFQLYKDIENSNSVVAALSSQMNQRQRKAFNKVLFFELELAKIPKEKQIAYLKNPEYKHFAYYLNKIFKRAKYNLSEKEEQIFSLLSEPGNNMWYDAQNKLLSEQIVSYKGKKISLSQATEMYPNLPKKERESLFNQIVAVRKSTAHLAEPELNAIYTFKKISDELRGYSKPYSQTVIQYENEEKEVEALVDTITRNFSLSKKFYNLHRKLLKESKLTLADLYRPAGNLDQKFDFESSVEIVKRAFSRFDQKYADIVDTYLKNGQIDVFPKRGKKGGAYSSGLAHLPVFVLFNHADNLKSVETFAHEMGHSIHTELSKHLDPLYSEYTIAVAEVASTFFEQFVSDEVINQLPDDQKIIVLHQRINNDMATVFRQIACFNCEYELHQQIRQKGQLSKDEMAKIMQKHLKSYIGDAIHITEDDGYVFTSWTHLRYSFYVYTYAYGYLISRALYERWKKDKSFRLKIEQFLSAGNSMSPKDIFKSIGINTDVAFFESGIKGIESDIKQLEKLAKKQKLI